jgi:hypothetical protein
MLWRSPRRAKGLPWQQRDSYAYPDEARRALYLITLGDKKSQKDDIRVCKDFVARLSDLAEEDSDEKNEDIPERLPNGAGDDR